GRLLHKGFAPNMSQYNWPQDPRNQAPSPYTPGYGGYSSFDDGLGPARTAGVMLFVLGGLGILMSMCLVGGGAMIQQVIQSQPNIRQQMGGLEPDVLRIVMLVLGGAGVLVSIVYIVLGVFVRKGSLAATIIAMVLTVLIELYCIFNLFVSLSR